MTRKSFHSELENLQEKILKMGGLVEEAIAAAVDSLIEKDTEKAKCVLEKDDIVDEMELRVEERCLRLLALQQPMAGDLRIIGTALKIITDLERMADHACDIAKVTLKLEGQNYIKPLVDIPRMAEIVQKMVSEALDAYVHQNKELALKMVERDNDVDSLYKQIFRELLVLMMEDPKNITQGTYLLFVASYLERVADHATNLGEWIIFMITGERLELND